MEEKKIRNSNEVEYTEPPSKKGGRAAVTSSISAATLAKALSGIDLIMIIKKLEID